MTKLLAFAVPILPGKTEQWRKFSNDLKTRYNKEFIESRKRLGVQERTFLQSTPQGDMVIVTLTGNDPERAMVQMGQGTDEFTRWFNTQVKDIHGVDLTQRPEKMPELVVETPAVAEYAK